MKIESSYLNVTINYKLNERRQENQLSSFDINDIPLNLNYNGGKTWTTATINSEICFTMNL